MDRVGSCGYSQRPRGASVGPEVCFAVDAEMCSAVKCRASVLRDGTCFVRDDDPACLSV